MLRAEMVLFFAPVRGVRRAVAVVLVAAMLAGPGLPTSFAMAAPSSTSPVLVEVRALYDDGKAKYDTLDFTGAIDLWTRAYGRLPESAEYQEIRNNLVYNIAAAQEKAYELDASPTHLRQARGLLDRYLTTYMALTSPGSARDAEIAKVKERMADLDRKLGASGATAAGGAPVVAGGPAHPEGSSMQPPQPAAPPGTAATTKPPAPRGPRGSAVARLIRSDPGLHQRYRKAQSFIIGGSVSLALGLVALGIAGIFAGVNGQDAIRLTPQERRQNRRGAIGSGLIGLAGVATGATLLGLGLSRRKAVQNEARQRVAFFPLWTPRFAGAGMQLVF